MRMDEFDFDPDYFKPRMSSQNSYPRARACSNCRRRKTKCDGVRPTCGPCNRAQVPQDCEYVGIRGVSQNELLEEQINILQMRIDELERPNNIPGGGPVYLHHPYITTPSSQNSGLSSSQASLLVKRDLIRSLMESSLQFSFCLHAQTFSTLSLTSPPPQRAEKDCWKYLILVAQVCGTIALHHRYGGFQQRLLQQALSSRAQALLEREGRENLVVLQAEILLTRFFMYTRKFTEATYHCCAALALVLSLKLHVVREVELQQGAIHEMERVNLFWAAYENDCLLALSQNTTKNSTDRLHLMSLNIPWPGVLPESSLMPMNGMPSNVLLDWQDERVRNAESDSVQALLVKSASLLYIASTANSLGTPPSLQKLMRMSSSLFGLLQARNWVEGPEVLHYAVAQTQTLVAQIMIDSAHLQVQPQSDGSRKRRRDLAVQVLQLASLLPSSGGIGTPPVLLPGNLPDLWTFASRIVYEERNNQSFAGTARVAVGQFLEVVKRFRSSSPPPVAMALSNLAGRLER